MFLAMAQPRGWDKFQITKGTSENELSRGAKIWADISPSVTEVPSPMEKKSGNTRVEEVLEAGRDFTAE